MDNNWSDPVPCQTVCRRANGRRHYNALRQFQALIRRHALLELLASGRYGSLGDHGVQTRLAAVLGVHRTTVCRDIQVLLQQAREHRACPLCGHQSH